MIKSHLRRQIERLPGTPRGQALVETALILPIILILLLGAIDFGRAFFGYVTLHQAARIGANYAAMNPNMTPAQRDEYVELINRDIERINCNMEAPPNPTYTTPAGAPVATASLGDYASLTLTCDFELITPLAGTLFGDLSMRATSVFPVRDGCVDCVATTPVAPPVAADPCRAIPEMVDMSVEGARLAWVSRGFSGDNFNPSTGQDTSTVESQNVVEADPLFDCPAGSATFASTVTVDIAPAELVGPGCATVPNLIGLTVAQARSIWEGSEFTGEFEPVNQDSQRVASQTTTPDDSDPGVTCLALESDIEIDTASPWPDAPPAPCKVPNLINVKVNTGDDMWVSAGFSLSNWTGIGNGNFTIRSQSLVGGGYVICSATIIVTDTPEP